MRKTRERRLKIAEMHMLRWICGCTMFDYIPNENFKRVLGIEYISSRLTEGHLRRYGHLRRRCISTSVRQVEDISVTVKERKVDRVGHEKDQLSLYITALNVRSHTL